MKEIKILCGELLLLHYSFGKQIKAAEEALRDLSLTLTALKNQHGRLGLMINPKNINPKAALSKLKNEP